MQKYIITYGADNDTAKIEATSVEHAIDQFNNMPNRPGAIVGIDLIVPYLDWPTFVDDRTMAGVGNRPEDATGLGAQFDHLVQRPTTVSASFWDGLSASDKEFVAQHEAIHAECDKAAASRAAWNEAADKAVNGLFDPQQDYTPVPRPWPAQPPMAANAAALTSNALLLTTLRSIGNLWSNVIEDHPAITGDPVLADAAGDISSNIKAIYDSIAAL